VVEPIKHEQLRVTDLLKHANQVRKRWAGQGRFPFAPKTGKRQG